MRIQKVAAALLAITISSVLTSCAAKKPRNNSGSEAELKATEIAFARTMETRDHEAFVSFLAPDTVFFGSGGPLRGRDVVASAWKPLFENESAPFSWAPEEVAVLESGDLGFSSGPVVAPDGSSMGSFNSVWQRQADDSWKIIFDKGCPPCCGDGS